MFERYTEKARRVIFFARHEASQYGSPVIDTEHLLLGLLREEPALVPRFLSPSGGAASIRAATEKHITPGERIPTSVEMPLSEGAKKALNLAAEECDRFGHRHIGTGHVLLGLLRVEGSLAAKTLRDGGVKIEAVREHLTKSHGAAPTEPRPSSFGLRILDAFLAALKESESTAGQICSFFANDAQFIDCNGNRWMGFDEIEKHLGELFAPYTKKNVRFVVESRDMGLAKSVIASVLWENVSVPCQPARSTHRMTIILAPYENSWSIFFMQVTPGAPN